MSEHNDLKLGDWLLPKDKLMIAVSYTAHRDENIWNTGTPTDPRPLHEFWAERFLIYPDDPNSGPLRNVQDKHEKLTPVNSNTSGWPDIREKGEKNRRPRFSTNRLAGAWVPYGGGRTLCPGRHFAKQEMLGTLAILAAAFDVEILQKDGERTGHDLKYFGLGRITAIREDGD
jgi:cytochrome P450